MYKWFSFGLLLTLNVCCQTKVQLQGPIYHRPLNMGKFPTVQLRMKIELTCMLPVMNELLDGLLSVFALLSCGYMVSLRGWIRFMSGDIQPLEILKWKQEITKSNFAYRGIEFLMSWRTHWKNKTCGSLAYGWGFCGSKCCNFQRGQTSSYF